MLLCHKMLHNLRVDYAAVYSITVLLLVCAQENAQKQRAGTPVFSILLSITDLLIYIGISLMKLLTKMLFILYNMVTEWILS